MIEAEFVKAIQDNISELIGAYEAVKKRLKRIPDNEKGKRGEVYLELTEIQKEIEQLKKTNQMKILSYLRKTFFPTKEDIVKSARRDLYPTAEESVIDRKKNYRILAVGFISIFFFLWLIFSR